MHNFQRKVLTYGAWLRKGYKVLLIEKETANNIIPDNRLNKAAE